MMERVGVRDITDVGGIRVGHWTSRAAATGCSVVVCEDGAVGGVDVRGSAPGTRETDLLRPTAMVNEVHAVLLSGGSAFGLAAATGVVRWLEERGVGLRFGNAVIPITPAAILFDLQLVQGEVRPGAEDGYAACENAVRENAGADGVAEGSVGAGTGATVAKALGMARAVKGGIGSAAVALGEGVVVGALVAVNAVGGVYEHKSGRVIAGPRGADGGMMDALGLMASADYGRMRRAAMADVADKPVNAADMPVNAPVNTTIGVVATNAAMNKAQANKMASAAQDGVALAVRPAHLMSDGDTMFALATGKSDVDVDVNRLLAAAALCVSGAIARGVEMADGLGGVPSVSEIAAASEIAARGLGQGRQRGYD